MNYKRYVTFSKLKNGFRRAFKALKVKLYGKGGLGRSTGFYKLQLGVFFIGSVMSKNNIFKERYAKLIIIVIKIVINF
jgi:hypothetical protein